MSMTISVTESNHFKVKNKKEVRQVLEDMNLIVYEDEQGEKLIFTDSGDGSYFDESVEVVMSIKPIKVNAVERNYIGIICENFGKDLEELLEENNLSEDEVMIIPIIEYLQDQLVDGFGISITSVSYESRMGGNDFPHGDIYVISKNKVEFFSTDRFALETSKKLNVEL